MKNHPCLVASAIACSASFMSCASSPTVASERAVASGSALSADKPAPAASLEACSRDASLFQLKNVASAQAGEFVKGARSASQFKIRLFEGYMISGGCARFISSFSDGIVLSNRVRYYRPGYPVPGVVLSGMSDRSRPVPEAASNLGGFERQISTISEIPSGFRYVQRLPVGENLWLVLWTGRAGSLVGRVKCKPNAGVNSDCTDFRPLLTSRFPIREIGFQPSPDGHPSSVISAWITPNPSEQTYLSYAAEDIAKS